LVEDESSTQGRNTENLGLRNMTVSCCLLHRAYAGGPLCDFSKCLPLYIYGYNEPHAVRW